MIDCEESVVFVALIYYPSDEYTRPRPSDCASTQTLLRCVVMSRGIQAEH